MHDICAMHLCNISPDQDSRATKRQQTVLNKIPGKALLYRDVYGEFAN